MRRRRARGFTLIEVLVALSIAALLLVVVPPAFDRLRESARYRETLRTLLADLRTAHQRAMARGVDVVFRVDPGARTYGIEGQPPRTLDEPLQLRALVAGQEVIAGQAAGIRFVPGGGATGGSVELVRPSGQGARLVVDWLSGRVSQEPLQP